MQIDIKKEFIRRLRLGGYTQTRDFLKRGNRFCVLGLLCEMFREKMGQGEWVGPYDGKNGVKNAFCFLLFDDEWSVELPSRTILNWAEISKDFAIQLYKLNDIERQTFAGIANYLETTTTKNPVIAQK